MFYSETTGGFYSREIHGDNMPADVVEITADEHAALLAGQSSGLAIKPDESGRPHLVEQEVIPPTVETVEAARLRAYADPVTGSDRLFVEASRMQMMGESGWEAVRDAAAARYQEIQLEHPWP